MLTVRQSHPAWKRAFYRSLTIILLLLIWIWATRNPVGTSRTFIPGPLEIWQDFWEYRSILLTHLGATLLTTVQGFLLGLLLAGLTCLLVLYWKKAEGFFSFAAVVLYSVPLIAAAPLAALVFHPNNSGIVLGAMGAYLPIFITGLSYSKNISRDLQNVAQGFGITALKEIQLIRLPLMLRGCIIGSQSGWVWAVLGALLGDFTGRQFGLGIFLIGSIVQGNRAKVWVIIFLCLLISLLGFFLIRLFSALFVLDSSFDAINLSNANVPPERLQKGRLKSLGNALLLLLIWQVLSWALHYSGGIVAGPLDMVELIGDITNGRESFSWHVIFSAARETWALAFGGVLLSITLAFLLATIQRLATLLGRPVQFLLLITQVTPIVAFIPLIALYLGRGSSSVILIVILSTIYPSYITFSKAFYATSRGAIDIARGFGASRWLTFLKIEIPYAAGSILIAIRLAIGRALLGAITGEYLLTGLGLGGLLGQNRAQLDFRVIWFICTIIALTTLVSDQLVLFLRKRLVRLFSFLRTERGI